MQTIISEIAFTFVDDAIALASGFVGVIRTLAVENFEAIRARLCAPVDRLARACDVGGVIAARQTALARRGLRTSRQATPPRRWHERLNPFRGLYDLT